MQKILAFTGSNSETSINDQLLRFTLDLLQTTNLEYIDLKPLEVPIYSETLENSKGIPEDILSLRSSIDDSQALIVAVNEHNGTMSAFFKNITDWLSRTGSYLEGKKICLLATSPGQGGAKFCLDYTQTNFEKFGGTVCSKFSLPNFNQHFKNQELQDTYKSELMQLIQKFENELN